VRYAVCIKNKVYAASLEKGKMYRVISDQEADAHGYLRVVDESNEDYGYAASRFFIIELPSLLLGNRRVPGSPPLRDLSFDRRRGAALQIRPAHFSGVGDG
jgi:hypothetical protein